MHNLPKSANSQLYLFVGRHGWEGDAVVQVTLLNNSQGYKFDEYGESITVKRTIKKPSGGGFALISHDGQVSAQHETDGDLLYMTV